MTKWLPFNQRMSWDTHEKPSTWQRLLQLQDGFNRSWRIEKATLPFPPLQRNSVKHYLISSLSLHQAWDSQCHSEQTLRPWSYLTTPTCGPFNIGNSAKCQNQHLARKRTVTTINIRSPLFPIGVYLWDVLCHTQVRPLQFVVSPKGILKLRIWTNEFLLPQF